MRIVFVIVASLAIIWPGLSTAALAEQPPPGESASPQAKAEASPDDLDGEQVFLNTCGFCHQNGGRAAGRGPKLSKSERSDEFIIERIKKGKTGAMPAFGSVFSEGQIIAILAYIRGLDD
jgi:mono/diheme cytochrome c family protein